MRSTRWARGAPRVLAAIVLMAALAHAPAQQAHGATFTLDSCSHTGFDVLALWDAVLRANDETQHPGTDTINLATGCDYLIHDSYPGTGFGIPPITSSVAIVGNHAAIRTDRDADGPLGLFQVEAGAGLVLTGMDLRNPVGNVNGTFIANAGAVLVNHSTLTGFLGRGMAGPAVVNAAGASLTLLDSEIRDMHFGSATHRGAAIDNQGDLYVVGSDLIDNNALSVIIGAQTSKDPAISNDGYVEITDSTVLANRSTTAGNEVYRAGGISNDGTMVVRRSLVGGMENDRPGAGINNSGSLRLEASTLWANRSIGAAGRGGGLFNSGDAAVVNSVIEGNFAAVAGGGIYNQATLSVWHTTFVGNAGDIANTTTGAAVLTASIIGHCAGSVSDGGSNLVDAAHSGCPGAVGDAKLVPWPFAGVAGKVYRLGPGSDAIDAVADTCATTDQRGMSRPGGGACDIGAYENQVPSAATSLILANGVSPGNTGNVTLDWSDATDADHDALTYRLYGRDFDDAGESLISSGSASSAALTSLAEGTYRFRAEAFDGNHSSASANLMGVVVDQTAPSSPTGSTDRPPDVTAPDGTGWFRDSVDVTFGGSTDALLADGSKPSGIASVTSVQSFATSGEHTAVGIATDKAGNTSVDTSVTVHVDADAPSIAFSACPPTVLLGSPTTLRWAGSDPHSGLATAASGTVAVDTSTIGARSLTASATDKVGHTAIATCAFKVIYDFGGYFSPVENPPTPNKASAGQTVSIVFSLAGNKGLGVIAAGYPASAAITCGSNPVLTSGSPTTPNKPGLTFDKGRYTYQWRTDKAWIGTCRQLVVLLNDGTYHRANFSFK